MPSQIYLLLKSYLTKRYFQVKTENILTNYHPIKAGVPQGSVLGPFLYVIFTCDIPLTDNTIMATFADYTAILSSDKTQREHLKIYETTKLTNGKLRLTTRNHVHNKMQPLSTNHHK